MICWHLLLCDVIDVSDVKFTSKLMNVLYCHIITTSSLKFVQIFALHKQITVFLFCTCSNESKIFGARFIHAAMQFVIVLIGLHVYGVVFSMLLHSS